MTNKPKLQTNPSSWQDLGLTPWELMAPGPSCHFPYNPVSHKDLLRACVRPGLWALWRDTKKEKTWPQLSRAAHVIGMAKHAPMKIVAGIKRIRRIRGAPSEVPSALNFWDLTSHCPMYFRFPFSVKLPFKVIVLACFLSSLLYIS